MPSCRCWRSVATRGPPHGESRKTAGINEITLFRRFGDKRQLILAAIHADISRLASNGLTATGELEADLIRVVEYYSDLYQHRDGLARHTPPRRSARDPDVAALIKEPLGPAMSRIGEIFASYQQTGEMVEEPTDSAVQALLAPLLVITAMRRLTSSEIALPDARTVVDRFFKGHLAKH